ncbi:Cas9 inhibitor AcrIIA9 family protein [Enterococcus italicus]|uniref:Cas9 inhibitor AcrIIA9 family protein n=1 Tax=Enterococcus italicus TaxID=246144 RepID=UPI003F47E761
MNAIKQRALDKMLNEMNEEHTGSEDRIHNWLCDQNDDQLLSGILKDGKSIRKAIEFCSDKARALAVQGVAIVDDGEVYKWVHEYFTTEPAKKVKTKNRKKDLDKEIQEVRSKNEGSTVTKTRKKVDQGEQLSLLDFL